MTTARELTNRLAELLRRERTAMADFLVALADFDRQELWRELGYASLFSFLRRELSLSAGAAQYRKTAAELIQRFPEVEAGLRAGRLCLSSVIELAKILTPENVADVLPRFFGLSSREAAFVAVSIRPIENAPRREVVTPLRPVAPAAAHETVPTGRQPLTPTESQEAATLAFRAPEVPATTSAPAPAAPTEGPCRPVAPAKPTTVQPLDAERLRMHMTVSRRFLAKLEAAKDALSHSRPGAASEEVLEACMDLLLARHAKRKGLVERPRATVRPATSGAIPAAVKREAWRRAGGRCEWPLDSGGVCGSALRLEFDHITPRAHGGPSTIENVRVLCNNQYAARRAFGDEWMNRFTGKGGRADQPGDAPP